MLKLKLQYLDHLMRRTDSLEKTLMLGKIEGRRRRGQQRMRWLDGITDSMDMSLVNSRSWRWTGRPGVLQSMVSQRIGQNRAANHTCTHFKCCWCYRVNSVKFLLLCCCSVAQSCLSLCNSMDCSTSGFPVLCNHPEFAQTHVC